MIRRPHSAQFSKPHRCLLSEPDRSRRCQPAAPSDTPVAAASFGIVGGEYKYTVTFGTAYSNNNYAISVVGGDAVSWTIESKGASQFTINSNQSSPLTADVYWITTPHNN